MRFRYPDQDDNPKAVAPNKTDHDCGAMIAFGDSLCLFTNQWTGRQTLVYSIPKTAGSHTAIKRSVLDVNGLVTGADIHPNRHIVALAGYTKTFTRFAYLLYDFACTGLLDGDKRSINLQGPGQTESAAFMGQGLLAHGSEGISILKARLETYDFSEFLGEFLPPLARKSDQTKKQPKWE